MSTFPEKRIEYLFYTPHGTHTHQAHHGYTNALRHRSRPSGSSAAPVLADAPVLAARCDHSTGHFPLLAANEDVVPLLAVEPTVTFRPKFSRGAARELNAALPPVRAHWQEDGTGGLHSSGGHTEDGTEGHHSESGSDGGTDDSSGSHTENGSGNRLEDGSGGDDDTPSMHAHPPESEHGLGSAFWSLLDRCFGGCCWWPFTMRAKVDAVKVECRDFVFDLVDKGAAVCDEREIEELVARIGTREEVGEAIKRLISTREEVQREKVAEDGTESLVEVAARKTDFEFDDAGNPVKRSSGAKAYEICADGASDTLPVAKHFTIEPKVHSEKVHTRFTIDGVIEVAFEVPKRAKTYTVDLFELEKVDEIRTSNFSIRYKYEIHKVKDGVATQIEKDDKLLLEDFETYIRVDLLHKSDTEDRRTVVFRLTRSKKATPFWHRVFRKTHRKKLESDACEWCGWCGWCGWWPYVKKKKMEEVKGECSDFVLNLVDEESVKYTEEEIRELLKVLGRTGNTTREVKKLVNLTEQVQREKDAANMLVSFVSVAVRKIDFVFDSKGRPVKRRRDGAKAYEIFAEGAPPMLSAVRHFTIEPKVHTEKVEARFTMYGAIEITFVVPEANGTPRYTVGLLRDSVHARKKRSNVAEREEYEVHKVRDHLATKVAPTADLVLDDFEAYIRVDLARAPGLLDRRTVVFRLRPANPRFMTKAGRWLAKKPKPRYDTHQARASGEPKKHRSSVFMNGITHAPKEPLLFYY